MKEGVRELLKDAMVQEFNETYGTEDDDIESWKKPCKVCRIVPEDLDQCRAVSSWSSLF
jgi:hypothetical protein